LDRDLSIVNLEVLGLSHRYQSFSVAIWGFRVFVVCQNIDKLTLRLSNKKLIIANNFIAEQNQKYVFVTLNTRNSYTVNGLYLLFGSLLSLNYKVFYWAWTLANDFVFTLSIQVFFASAGISGLYKNISKCSSGHNYTLTDDVMHGNWQTCMKTDALCWHSS
jgi:hypothetical protein